jgi:hypothetical protein
VIAFLPRPPVLEILPGNGILAAQEGSRHTAIDAVIDTNLSGIEQKPAANLRHGSSPRNGGRTGSKYGQMNNTIQMYTYLAKVAATRQVTGKTRKAFYPKFPNNPQVLGGTSLAMLPLPLSSWLSNAVEFRILAENDRAIVLVAPGLRQFRG